MADETRRRPIGLVVEGISEYHALPVFVSALEVRFATPANFHGQGHLMTPKALAARALSAVKAQLMKNRHRVIIVVDRETREACAPDLASRVLREIKKMLRQDAVKPGCPISVVCADRMLENWLLADRAGLSKHGAIDSDATPKQQANVDGKDGVAELSKLMVSKVSYSKGQLSGQLAEHVRVKNVTVQRRSRSLREFVKEVLA